MSNRLPRRHSRNPEEPETHGRFWHRVLLSLAILIFALASLYIAVIVVTWADDALLPGNEVDFGFLSSLPGADNSAPEVGTIEDRINFLVLGLDKRPQDPPELGTRTDTVFVFTVDPYSGTSGIFSIPRDLLVEIPNGRGGFFKERINIAYEYAPTVNYPGGGAKLAADTVEHNFDINIDYYLVVDFVDFIKLIDEIGGIDIQVTEPMAAWYSLDDRPQNHVFMRFEPGMQHMNGERALAYARIREGFTDLDRMKRQQQVVIAGISKAINVGLLPKAPSLWDKFNKSIETNIPSSKVLGLALLAKKVSPNNVVTVSLGDAVVDCPLGAAYLCPVPEKVAELKAQVFFDPKLRNEGAVIEIHNGTDRPGLAANVRGYLARQGLPEEDLVTNTQPAARPSQTVIFDVKGKKYTAEKVAEWLGVPKESIRNGTDLEALPATTTADIVIILGPDAKIPAG